MLRKLTIKYLPFPSALKDAVDRGEVGVSVTADGTIAYTISKSCGNVHAVRGAIAQRTRWEMWMTYADGALEIMLGFLAVVAFAKLVGVT